MSKIREKMWQAIRNNKPFSSGNTTVTIDANTAHVFLHGNHIASVICDKYYRCKTMVNIDTLRTYPTPTTKSRLRALNVDVRTRKGITYLEGKAI